MKICFVIGTLDYSGAEKIVSSIISSLQNEYEVEVVLLACEKPFVEYSIRQYPLYVDEKKYKNSIIRTFKRIWLMHKLFAENRFDLVVSFGCKYNLDSVLAMFGIMETKLILCERNDPVFDPQSRLLRLRRKIFYEFADGFVFQTDTIKSFFSERIQKKSTVIPNFVTNSPGYYYDPSNTDDIFATCGRLDNYQKDQITLIRVFAEFLKTHPKYKLEFYGSGPDAQKYFDLVNELNIKDNVFFHGYVKNPISKMTNAKFFIFPSKFEGMPNALIEALSFGIPCISTDCSGGGARYLIQDGKNGLLIPFCDEKALLSAMNSFADDYESAILLGKEGLKINEELKKDKIVQLWKKYFNGFKVSKD